MSSFLIVRATAVLSLFLIPGLAQAQAVASARPVQLQVKDGNGDGKISLEEFLAGLPAGQSAAVKDALTAKFAEMDKNQDGFLTADEMKATKPAAPTAVVQPLQLQLRDADGDGKISREEFLAGLPASQTEEMIGQLKAKFAALDKNQDGSLTMDELGSTRPLPPRDLAPAAPPPPDDEAEGETAWPAVAPAADQGKSCGYAVVISRTSLDKPDWKAVADALIKRHQGKLVVYDGSVANALPALASLHPRHTAFVARPEIVGRLFVARVHRLTRKLDADPYGDTIWGIVTSATPEAALRMAKATEPAVVDSVISNTGVPNELYQEVFTLSDGKKGDWVWKHRDGKNETGNDGDADRTALFIAKFKAVQPDAIITSGHATERNLEMPFSRGNTVPKDGQWYGMVNWKEPVLIEPDHHPRIFIGAGNCLIGNVKKQAGSMAATLTNAYDVNQLVGYTVPTWYGRGGWGTLALWQQPGQQQSLAEAWFFNNQTLIAELQNRFAKNAARDLPISEKGEGLDFRKLDGLGDKDEAGLLWDRDVVAFYGDPAFRVMAGASQKKPVELSLKTGKTLCTFKATVAKDATGGSPICMPFPKRLAGKIDIVSGQEFQPVVTDDFILLMKPATAAGKTSTVEFRVTP
jgi:zinc protease